MSYDGFSHYGIKIYAGFDKQKEIVGKTINNRNDYDFSKITEYSKKNNIEVAIFCVPIEEAQDVANLVTNNGVKAIYYFSPIYLIVNDYVIIENIDIASSISFLSAKLKMEIRPKMKEANKTNNVEVNPSDEVNLLVENPQKAFDEFMLLDKLRLIILQQNVSVAGLDNHGSLA